MLKLSVIIPCYNVERYLRQCLDSVLSQSLRDIEVICVDDGSTDGTLEILRAYERQDSRVRVLCQKNQFAGVARNTGIAAAGGEYIAFLDGDDYYVPGGLEKAYSTAKAHDLELMKLSSHPLDETTGEIRTTERYLHARVETKYQLLSFREHWKQLLRCMDVPWNGLYKRSFLEQHKIQFSDLRCSNDRSFFIHCVIAARRAMVTDDVLTVHRQNVDGSLVAVRHRYFDCQIRNYELVRDIVNAAELPETVHRQLMQRELEQIFIWYKYFLESGVDVIPAEGVLRRFIATYDPRDVGEHFLSVFRFKEYYNRLKDNHGSSRQENKPETQLEIGRLKSYWIHLRERGFKATARYGLYKMKSKFFRDRK